VCINNKGESYVWWEQRRLIVDTSWLESPLYLLTLSRSALFFPQKVRGKKKSDFEDFQSPEVRDKKVKIVYSHV
jgi:hypothetical protein